MTDLRNSEGGNKDAGIRVLEVDYNREDMDFVSVVLILHDLKSVGYTSGVGTLQVI